MDIAACLRALIKCTSHPLSHLNMVLTFVATICWNSMETTLPSLREMFPACFSFPEGILALLSQLIITKTWLIRVFSPVSYSRRRDARRENQASSCGSSGRHRHGDGADDSGPPHLALHLPPPDLQHQPFLHRGQSAELSFCCSGHLFIHTVLTKSRFQRRSRNTSDTSLFSSGIFPFFFPFPECFAAFQPLPSAAAEPLARAEVQPRRRLFVLHRRGVSRPGQRHAGGHRPQAVLCPVRAQGERAERRIHRSGSEGALPGCRLHLTQNSISHKALGQS